MRKASVLVLILLICYFWIGLLAIPIVKAERTIYIRTDGSIEGTDKIERNGKFYTLTDDIINSTITVTCNNVVLDGSGFTLRGTTGWISGISAINITCSNVTVKNFNIIGFWEAGILGVYDGNTIISNNITKTDRAISIYANDYHIESNYLANNHIGVRIVGKNNNVTQNYIVDNYKGFRITNSSNNYIVANIIEENMEAITTDYGGFQVYHNNFINQTIGSGGGWEAMILSTNNIYSGLNVTLEPEWDNGYPSGGNYWSDYAIKYPNAKAIGDSGIGDTAYLIGIPYAINSTYANTYIVEAIDRYPLMTPFKISEPVIPISSPNLSPSQELEPAPFPALLTIISVAITLLAFGAGLGLLIYRIHRKKHKIVFSHFVCLRSRIRSYVSFLVVYYTAFGSSQKDAIHA